MTLANLIGNFKGPIAGQTDGATIPTGQIGQVINFTTRSVTVSGTENWYSNATAMGTLTAGVWLVLCFYNANCNASTNAVSVAGVSISSTPGTGLQTQTSFNLNNTGTSQSVSGPCVSFVYNSSSSTDIYAQFYSYNSSAVNTTVGGYAIRIA